MQLHKVFAAGLLALVSGVGHAEEVEPTGFLAPVVEIRVGRSAQERQTFEVPAVDLRAGLTSQDASLSGLLNQAFRLVGVRYRFGGVNPTSGVDCSGFVQIVFQRALSVNLPRTAREMGQLGQEVAMNDLKPGDLLLFNTLGRSFSHVGIYVGDGRFIHASSKRKQVRVDSLHTAYNLRRFEAARRII
jgi:cell wall-associated NlpC family hydrolase